MEIGGKIVPKPPSQWREVARGDDCGICDFTLHPRDGGSVPATQEE